MQGWIKLHRKIRSNEIFNDMNLFRLWVICLTEASHKEHKQLVGKQMVDIQAGQFVTGRFHISELYNKGLSTNEKKNPLTVWRWMDKLQKFGFLNINSNNKFSIATVVNWCYYQVDEQQIEHQMNNKSTSDEQQMFTNKNGNNGENDENGNKETPRRKFIYDDLHMKMAKYFVDCIRTFLPSFKQPNMDRWANDFRMLNLIDERNKDEIRVMIEFVTKHHFWHKNCMSPSAMREKWDRLQVELNSQAERKGGQQHGQRISQRSDKDSIVGNKIGWHNAPDDLPDL
jgi:hypothetical protein